MAVILTVFIKNMQTFLSQCALVDAAVGWILRGAKRKRILPLLLVAQRLDGIEP
jgi:hypothetical protein